MASSIHLCSATLRASLAAISGAIHPDVTEHDDEIWISVSARSFLHHQVRNITGSLVLIGQGRWSNDDLLEALNSRDRSAAGQTAPAEGLYLTDVIYR